MVRAADLLTLPLECACAASFNETTTIGADLAKNVFQLHDAAADGTVVFRKKLSRVQFARFVAGHPPFTVAMDACVGAHHWARELAGKRHRVPLIAPHYAEPFTPRQKNEGCWTQVRLRMLIMMTTPQRARSANRRAPR